MLSTSDSRESVSQSQLSLIEATFPRHTSTMAAQRRYGEPLTLRATDRMLAKVKATSSAKHLSGFH